MARVSELWQPCSEGLWGHLNVILTPADTTETLSQEELQAELLEADVYRVMAAWE